MKCLTLVVLCSLVAVPAGAEVVSHDHLDLSGIIASPCNGESIQLSGGANVVNRVTTDGNGVVHLGVHANVFATGTGSNTGTKYRIKEIVNLNFKMSGSEQNIVHSFHVIAQGMASDYFLKETWHLTVNANGDVAIFRMSSATVCK